MTKYDLQLITIRKEMIKVEREEEERHNGEDGEDGEDERKREVTIDQIEAYLEEKENCSRPSTLLVGNSVRRNSELLPIGTLLF